MGWGLSPKRLSQEHKENIFFWNAINWRHFSQILKAGAPVTEERYKNGEESTTKVAGQHQAITLYERYASEDLK